MRQVPTYAPDWIDVSNITRELGDTFNLRVQVTSEYTADEFIFTARAYRTSGDWGGVVVFQSLSRSPLRSVKDYPTVAYNLLFDIYMQADGGGATAARRGPPRSWSGRVQTPRSRKG